MKEELDTFNLVESGIPSRYWGDFEDSFVPRNAYKWAQDYVRRFPKVFETGQSVWFHGVQDAGKTSLVCFVLMQAMMDGHEVRRFTLESLTDLHFSDKRYAFEQTIRNQNIVGIDNVNSLIRPHQGKVDTLERALSICKEWQIPCLLASDISDLNDFEQHYGHRSSVLVERYYQHCELSPNRMRMKDYFDAYRSDF